MTAKMTATRWGPKTVTLDLMIEILNADGKPEEIGKLVGRSGGTVRKYLKVLTPCADLFRRGWLEEKLIKAGVCADRDAFDAFRFDDGEIAAVIGLHHWRKCRQVVAQLRNNADNHAIVLAETARLERENEGWKIVNGCMERHLKQARAGGSL